MTLYVFTLNQSDSKRKYTATICKNYIYHTRFLTEIDRLVYFQFQIEHESSIEDLRWLNTVFDTSVSFTFFSKTHDLSVAKNGSKQVNNTNFGFLMVKLTYVPLPWQHEKYKLCMQFLTDSFFSRLLFEYNVIV